MCLGKIQRMLQSYERWKGRKSSSFLFEPAVSTLLSLFVFLIVFVVFVLTFKDRANGYCARDTGSEHELLHISLLELTWNKIRLATALAIRLWQIVCCDGWNPVGRSKNEHHAKWKRKHHPTAVQKLPCIIGILFQCYCINHTVWCVEKFGGPVLSRRGPDFEQQEIRLQCADAFALFGVWRCVSTIQFDLIHCM